MASFDGFRVVCDMSDFFSDIRRKLLIYVDPSKDRCIADLVNRIKSLTGLCQRPNIVFAIGDCLLPMSEDIRILHEEDILKASTSTHNILPVFESDLENNPELGKHTHNDGRKKKKKKKLSESESLQPEENVIRNEREVDVQTSVTDSCSTNEIVDPIVAVANVNDSHGKRIATPEDNLGETKPSTRKRKRTRVRVRHRHSDKNKVVVDDSTHTNVVDMKMSSVTIRNPTFSHCSPKLKHIRFSDCSDNERAEISYDYETRELSNQLPQTLPIVAAQNAPHVSTPFRHNVQLQPKSTQWDIKHRTSTSNQETVGNGNTSDGNYAGNQNNMFSKLLALANSTPLVVKHSRPPIVETRSVPIAKTPLQGLPKGGDILTFKILRMDENYCPQVSNPITAKVLLYSNATNELSVEILDGRDQCQQPKGKFAIETDEDEITEQQSSVIQLNWNEIIEPYRSVF